MEWRSCLGYIDDNLTEDEHIVYRAKLHWTTLLGPTLLAFLAILWIPSKGFSAVVLLFIAALWGISSSVSLKTSEFIVTNKRVLIQKGFLRKKSYELLLTKIEGIEVYQPILGRMLNFGKIVIRSTGGIRHSLRLAENPLEFRKRVQEQINPAQRG